MSAYVCQHGVNDEDCTDPACYTPPDDEISRLRAELAQVQAERDEWKSFADKDERAGIGVYRRRMAHYMDECDRIRAESDEWKEKLKAVLRQMPTLKGGEYGEFAAACWRADEYEDRAKKAEAEAAAMKDAAKAMVAFLGDVILGSDPVAMDPERKIAKAFNDAFTAGAGSDYINREEAAALAVKAAVGEIPGEANRSRAERAIRAALTSDKKAGT